MIDPETAVGAAQLLSTAIGEMVEDEHTDMVSTLAGSAPALARAQRLRALGRDVTVLAEAMAVLLTRSGEAPR